MLVPSSERVTLILGGETRARQHKPWENDERLRSLFRSVPASGQRTSPSTPARGTPQPDEAEPARSLGMRQTAMLVDELPEVAKEDCEEGLGITGGTRNTCQPASVASSSYDIWPASTPSTKHTANQLELVRGPRLRPQISSLTRARKSICRPPPKALPRHVEHQATPSATLALTSAWHQLALLPEQLRLPLKRVYAPKSLANNRKPLETPHNPQGSKEPTK